MRIVTEATDAAWRSAVKAGPTRPVVRATIERCQMRKRAYNTADAPGGDYNHKRDRTGVFTSLLFGGSSDIREIPNIKKSTWSRSTDQDIAEATLTILNAGLIPIGSDQEPTEGDLDIPGMLSFNRGNATVDPNRWGHVDAGWNGVIVPDRVIKTYEGYGCDKDVPPGDDPNLYIAGTWLIDDVDYNAAGDIVISMRDLIRLLVDHIAFPPVVPWDEYPLEWSTIRSVNIDGRDATGGSWEQPRAHATSSNNEYIGKGIVDTPNYVGNFGGVQGHQNHDPIRGTIQDDYWMSTGQESPDSFVWWEEEFDAPIALAGVRLRTYSGPFKVYISIEDEDGWIGRTKIPYVTTTEGINLGAKIRFIHSEVIERAEPVDIIFKRKYDNIRRIRITFTRLRRMIGGKYPWRAGLRDIKVYTGNYADLGFGSGSVLTPVGNYRDYCADEATEILTKRGWLRWDQVEAGDETLAIDPETGMSGWQVIESVYRKHRQREMMSMESSVHSSLTTPDHRWLITDHAGRRQWRTTETLKHGHSVPLAAPRGDQPSCARYDDAFVELVGWFWTEGWTYAQGGCVNAYVAQSRKVNSKYCDRIERALDALAGPAGIRCGRESSWSMRERPDGVVTYALGQKLTRELLAVAPGKIVSPEFLTSLTAEQLELFIETSVDADGHRIGKRRFISQASEDRIRSFEMACALAGIGTSVSRRATRWELSLLAHRNFRPAATRRERVAYDGMIWCPTLKHHNWLARRNGKVYFTGNTDIVKWVCAWSGFWWPDTASENWIKYAADGPEVHYTYPVNDQALPKGRVWGSFQSTGTAGVADLTADNFDKQPLLDVISSVRDTTGFLFFADECGGPVWRMPNLYELGNYVTSDHKLPRRQPARTTQHITIDEEETLLEYGTRISSRNLREVIFVADSNGKRGSAIKGYNPYPIGLRRTAGWTDMHFKSNRECRVAADMVAARQMFDWRRSKVTIWGNPAIQVDDQVRIYERVTNETFFHYVLGVSSTLDMEAGTWKYEIDTHWLGERPSDAWAVRVEQLDTLTQQYLGTLGEVD